MHGSTSIHLQMTTPTRCGVCLQWRMIKIGKGLFAVIKLVLYILDG